MPESPKAGTVAVLRSGSLAAMEGHLYRCPNDDWQTEPYRRRWRGIFIDARMLTWSDTEYRRRNGGASL